MPPSYGKRTRPVQAFAWVTLFTFVCALAFGGLVAAPAGAADERPIKIVALGDSLVAGLGLTTADTFSVKLEQALKSKGLAVTVVNAGVSGDTTSGGLARIDWSVPADTDAVILELGANDGLRGIDPKVTRKALDAILAHLRQRKIAVLLCGMRAPPNYGMDYAQAFEAIFPQLAKMHDVLLYPFFLDGIAGDRTLNQSDGLHPNAAGIDTIVARILPKVEELISRAKGRQGS